MMIDVMLTTSLVLNIYRVDCGIRIRKVWQRVVELRQSTERMHDANGYYQLTIPMSISVMTCAILSKHSTLDQ